MRAYQITSHETRPEVLDLPMPEPGPGEIRVKVGACGLNFADLLMQKGTYQETPALPFIGGMEVAGVVDALGPDTDGPAVGTRVAVLADRADWPNMAVLMPLAPFLCPMTCHLKTPRRF